MFTFKELIIVGILHRPRYSLSTFRINHSAQTLYYICIYCYDNKNNKAVVSIHHIDRAFDPRQIIKKRSSLRKYGRVVTLSVGHLLCPRFILHLVIFRLTNGKLPPHPYFPFLGRIRNTNLPHPLTFHGYTHFVFIISRFVGSMDIILPSQNFCTEMDNTHM